MRNTLLQNTLRRTALGALAATALASSPIARAVSVGSADVSLVQRHVETLASEGMEGRLTGTPGERRAGDYIVRTLKGMGAEPLPATSGYRLPFTFTAGVKDAGSTVSLRDMRTGEAQRWSGATSVQAIGFSETARVSGPVVFAGYGLSVPESASVGYDSYVGLDVTDKIVVALRYFPEDAEPEARAVLARYAALRYKALAARDRGAKALVIVAGPRSPNAGRTIPIRFDNAAASSGVVAVSVGADVVEALFTAVPDRQVADVQRRLDTGNPHVAGFSLPDIELTIDVKVAHETRTGFNIVGYLPSSDAAVSSESYVLLGAHYDHLGRGVSANSLAREDEAGEIHHGADDNASGVAAVLGAGQYLARMPRTQGIALGFWSGEEMGLLGSADFATRSPTGLENVAAYLNLDMVGRMRDNGLTVQGVGTSDVWRELLSAINQQSGFALTLQDDPYVPTDLMSFYQAGVPGLSLFTGSHADYHRPTDVPARINFKDLARVAEFSALVAGRIANLEAVPAYVKVERATPAGGRVAIRVFTGTIPDYTAADARGLPLSGVTGGGPADKAGLRQGDIIVEFAGRDIANIYDYTYALETVKAGEPVTVVFLRDGQRQETTLTPEARR